MFKTMFTPKMIGNCEVKNRLAVTAMVTNYCNIDGTATDRYISYHEEKAKGGWGLIITEDYAINEHAMGYQYIAGLWNDGQIEGHRILTDTVHKYGTKIFAQIYHAGRQSCGAVNGGVQPVAPSAIPCPWLRQLPRELTIGEIEQIVKDFATCALRVKKAGFDGVEVHAGHGYLIAEFMSPYANKRTDRYGGSLSNRLRFIREIYVAIREKVGNEFPITIRFSADEAVQGGRDMAETRVLVKIFEEIGFDRPNVKFAEDVLVGNVETGDRIVVAGGGEVGGETTAHLAMQQRQVTIVEMMPEILKELDGISTVELKKILNEYEVDYYVDTKVVEILDDGVIVENKSETLTIPADTVALALGYKPDNRLADQLKEIHKSVIVIGGAAKTSNALVAAREGFDAGMNL